MTAFPGGPTDREAKFGEAPPARSSAQRWVLATQGILTELNESSHLRIGGEPRPSFSFLSAVRLRKHWGVRSAAEARARIQWLRDEGHRFAFAARGDRSPEDFLGWDLVRVSCVAGWSYVAYHLTREEAWAAMLSAARSLRAQFDAWAEVGESYALGKQLWSGAPADDVSETSARLIAPGGAWDFAWEIDLSGEVPPPEDAPLPEVVVDAGGAGAYATIGEALDANKAPQRVVVRAGVYHESVRINAPVELVAEGDVVVRNGEGAPLVADHHAFVRGFRFEAGHDDEGQKMQAVWVGGNFLKLVDCVMTTERCGVYAGKDWANVFVDGCRIEKPGIHGVLTENGAHLAAVDLVVEAPEGCGVLSLGSGELYVCGVRITEAATPAFSLRGSNRAEVHDLEVLGGASNGLEVLGAASVVAHDLRIQDCGGTGVLVMSTADVVSEIHGATLTGNAGNDVGVVGGELSVQAAKLGGGAGCAVAVQNAASLQLERCAIAPTVHPLLWLMGSSLTVLIECELRNEAELAVFVDVGATVRLLSCDLEGVEKSALVFRGGMGLVLGGRIRSAQGGLFLDGDSRVLCRDVALSGTGEAMDGEPALAVREGASLVWIGGSIESAGVCAVAVEAGGSAAFTHAALSAPRGVALAIDGGHVALLGGTVAAHKPVDLAGDATLSADGTSFEPETASQSRLGLEEAAFAPFAITLGHGGALRLEIEADQLQAAFWPLGAAPDVEHAPLWIDLALEGLTLSAPLELGRFGSCATVETTSLADLRAIAARLRDVLTDEVACGALAQRLSGRLEAGALHEDDDDDGHGGEDDNDGDDGDDDGPAFEKN